MNDQTTGRIAYPGLRPFTREEFDLFFGRENCVDQMVDTLAANRFLAVLGTSGSGKSSLVRTGLLNALELGFLAAAGSDWQIADLRPRGHPIRSLAMALLELQGNSEPDEGEIKILSSFLRRGPRSLVEWYEAGHLPEGANLLVLVDQFEELFRYQDYSGREEAEAFVSLLIEAARETSLPLYVVITMRSEYLGACTLIDGLPEIINRGLYLTPRMSRDECRAAIEGPAAVCGFAIEEALVNKLLNDLTDFAPWEADSGHDQRRRLGRRADQLPLMQHVLNLLWQRARERDEKDIVLTLADYEAAGSLAGALDRHADEVAAKVDPADADIIDVIFRGLVTGKTVVEAVRRPTRFGELVELAGGRRESVNVVIDAFRAPGVNFLTPSLPEALADDTFIDISHESLIRQWQRLSACLDEEAQSADAWTQLLWRAERFKAGTGGLLTGLDLDNLVAWWRRAEPTEAWANRYGNNYAEARQFLDDSQTTEAELKRREAEDQRKLIEAQETARTGARFKRLSVALAAAVVLAVVGAGAAVYLWREANQQATLATQQAEIAEQQRQLADQQREEAEKQRQLADQERQRAEEQAQIADRERQRAEEQATRADQERARAVASAEEAQNSAAAARAAQVVAEKAREEAVAAREEAARANAKLVAQQLGARINAYHTAAGQSPGEIAKAGSLLSRAAEAAYVENPADATVENQTTVELLRPALSLQTMLTSATIPDTPVPGQDVTRWPDPPGGEGLTMAIGWSFVDQTEFARIMDPIGRVVARFQLPSSPAAYEKTPVGAAMIGPDIPVAVMATTDGNIWAAFGEQGNFAKYTDAVEGEVTRFDDIRYDPVGERLYIVYVMKPSSGFETRPRVMVLERDGSGWAEWSTVADFELGQNDFHNAPPSRIAGVVNDVLYAVVDNQLIAYDVNGGDRLFSDLGRVMDGTVTVDGKDVLVGTAAQDCGAEKLSPEPKPADPTELDTPTCLVLVDAASGDVLWHGAVDPQSRVRLRTAHSVGGLNPLIEVLVEVYPDGAPTRPKAENGPWVPNDMWVRTIKRADGTWSDSLARFDAREWGQDGLGEDFAVMAATGVAYPKTLTNDYVARLFEARVLPKLAGKLEDTSAVLAWALDGNELHVAHVNRKSGNESVDQRTDEAVEVRLYRPELGQFVLDTAYTPAPVVCPPSPDKSLGLCTFSSAAFAPDGNTLLLTTNYGDSAFISRGGTIEWRPNLAGNRRINSLTGLSPLDTAGSDFLARGRRGKLWRISRPADAKAPPGAESGRYRLRDPGADAAPATDGGTLKEIALSEELTTIIDTMDGFTTDPTTGDIYVWGDSGLLVMKLVEGDGIEAREEARIDLGTIADVASLGNGDFVLATSDGRITLYRYAKGAVTELDRVETDLSSFGSIKLSVANGEVVANAGDVGGYWLRSAGYKVDGDKLHTLFAIPWDKFIGQLSNGEIASVAFGEEVFADPPQLPSGEDLLRLTIMREQRMADDASGEFRHVFQMLATRPDGTIAEDEPTCATAAAVAARVEEADSLDDALNIVRRVCRTAPDGQAFADAADLDGRDRILALLPLAGSSPYALAMLTASLRAGAPAAAEALQNYGKDLVQLPTAGQMADFAAGAPIPARLAADSRDSANEYDPYVHWLLAIIAEREGVDAPSLAEALYHYARAERLFRAVGWPVPADITARRAALARVLADNVVIDVAKKVMADQPPPASLIGAGAVGSPVAALDEIAKWLGNIQGSAPTGSGLTVLVALVEEALGDELVATDPADAAAHYRKALQLIASTPATLSARGGVAGRIEDVESIRDKLHQAGATDADAEAATVVLGIVDASSTEPITRDGELRSAVREAFEQLAAADASQVDFGQFKDMHFDFLDYDWESRLPVDHPDDGARLPQRAGRGGRLSHHPHRPCRRGGAAALAGDARANPLLAEHARRPGSAFPGSGRLRSLAGRGDRRSRWRRRRQDAGAVGQRHSRQRL